MESDRAIYDFLLGKMLNDPSPVLSFSDRRTEILKFWAELMAQEYEDNNFCWFSGEEKEELKERIAYWYRNTLYTIIEEYQIGSVCLDRVKHAVQFRVSYALRELHHGRSKGKKKERKSKGKGKEQEKEPVPSSFRKNSHLSNASPEVQDTVFSDTDDTERQYLRREMLRRSGAQSVNDLARMVAAGSNGELSAKDLQEYLNLLADSECSLDILRDKIVNSNPKEE